LLTVVFYVWKRREIYREPSVWATSFQPEEPAVTHGPLRPLTWWGPQGILEIIMVLGDWFTWWQHQSTFRWVE
jgi:hypothetical protein